MADYPGIGYDGKRSQFQPDSGERPDYAEDGTPRIRFLYSETQWTITVVHTYISIAERDQILNFYEANKGTYITFNRTSDASQFSVLMLGRPVEKWVCGPYWEVTTRLVGTRL